MICVSEPCCYPAAVAVAVVVVGAAQGSVDVAVAALLGEPESPRKPPSASGHRWL